MPIDDGHACARRRDAEGLACAHVERDAAIVRVYEAAEDLERLPLELFFFARDEGDDVVEDVEGRDAGVACARDGLHGCEDAGFDGSECFFERAEGYDEACCGAVCVCEDEAFFQGGIVEGALMGDHGEVGGVDEGDDERDEGVAPVVFCV